MNALCERVNYSYCLTGAGTCTLRGGLQASRQIQCGTWWAKLLRFARVDHDWVQSTGDGRMVT